MPQHFIYSPAGQIKGPDAITGRMHHLSGVKSSDHGLATHVLQIMRFARYTKSTRKYAYLHTRTHTPVANFFLTDDPVREVVGTRGTSEVVCGGERQQGA